jgi:hypothetical protein
MLELHNYITIGNKMPGMRPTDNSTLEELYKYGVSIEDFYSRYVVPIAQHDFKLVPHFVEYTPWHMLLQDRARLAHDVLSKSNLPVVWSDVDILFIRECSDRLLELLGDNDVLAMNDGDDGISCGLVMYAPTANAIEFLENVANDEASYARAVQCDQEAHNKYRDMIKYELLPKDEFFSSAFWIGGVPRQGWRPTREVLPDNIRLFHATSAFGWDKAAILDIIKERVSR